MIATRIREVLQAEAARARAVDVRIGLGYTAVLTDSECAGVAYTPREDLDHGCSPLREAGPLAGRRVSDLLPYLESRKPIERAIGLAAANALVAARPPASVTGGDILRVLALRPTDRVGMVGCFEPLIAPLQAQVASLTIFERSGDRTVGVQPAERALDLLPTCSVALITSTALITESLDALLEAAAGCREVALLGPSTPLLPEVFADTPVTWLSGIRIRTSGEGPAGRQRGGRHPDLLSLCPESQFAPPPDGCDSLRRRWRKPGRPGRPHGRRCCGVNGVDRRADAEPRVAAARWGRP